MSLTAQHTWPLLDKFYNGKKYTFKKHKKMAKRARHEEFHKLADSLLRMVDGSIGEKKEEDIVAVGIGMGQFTSSSTSSSLHGSFAGVMLSLAHCHKYMHRDIMAGHSIVNILKIHIEKLEWPLYLHPVDKDGKHPWIERGGASTAGVKDAPGPSHQASGNGNPKRQAEKGSEADQGKIAAQAEGISHFGDIIVVRYADVLQ
ncbi:hypothetical protein BGX20_003887 [Mortierella sp. AD010]|nr:hypothetical protein BGX20_003887 [Mortierella sp. AD010]